MYKKLFPLIIVAGLFSFILIPLALSADLRGELDALDTVSKRWKTDSFIIKALIFITAIVGALIAAMQQSPSHRVKICSQTLSIFITVITSAKFFFYNFDYKTLDYWVTKIEGRKAELRLQYVHHIGDDGKFSDEQIAKKFRDDLMEFLKLINSAQERVMKSEKVAFNQTIISLAFAEDIKPSWISNPPKDDTQYI
jgi:hypothetical protein